MVFIAQLYIWSTWQLLTRYHAQCRYFQLWQIAHDHFSTKQIS